MWTHIYACTLHVRAHTQAPQPLLSPNDAQSPAAEKVNWKTCLKRSPVPLQAKGRSVLGKRERRVTARGARASYKAFLFRFCYWEGNKMGGGRGSA